MSLESVRDFFARNAPDIEIIELDGSTVPPSAWGTPLEVDPGEHVVLVTARGHRGRQLALHVPEGPASQGLAVQMQINYTRQIEQEADRMSRLVAELLKTYVTGR